jgi:molybdenum ABC transporter molybdate-binding protein
VVITLIGQAGKREVGTMNAKNHSDTQDWQVRVGVWVERSGRTVLGEGRLELLECIDRCRSISAAAREIGISYRHAWVTVQQINEAAGEPLVTASTGGSHGGGAALTDSGRLAVGLCRELQDRLQQVAAGLLPGRLTSGAEAVVHVAAAVSLEEVLGTLATDHALSQAGARVRLVLGASDELAEQILSGAAADLFLTADAGQLDRLATAEVVLPDTITKLAEDTLAGIGQGKLTGVRRPADLLGPKVRRVALAAPSCPLGGYTRAYLRELGLYDALLERAILVDHSRAVAGAVRAGQADAGLVYGSAASRASDCRVLFRAGDLPAPVRYAGAVLQHARQPDEARRFLTFLASPQAARRFRACGFLPTAPTA